MSRRGFAISMLSAHLPRRQTGLYYADPGEWLDFCRKEISTHVVLLHDDLAEEWILHVKAPWRSA